MMLPQRYKMAAEFAKGVLFVWQTRPAARVYRRLDFPPKYQLRALHALFFPELPFFA
jgi:hypothetical protein